MGLQFVLLCVCIGFALGAKPGQQTGNVDSAIEHVDWHYSDAMCLQILLVDCSTHVTQGDEQICGTDGQTYANHCLFSHAVCEFAYSQVHLGVQNHGPCPTTTTTTTIATTTTNAAPAVTATAPTTAAPAVTSTAPTNAATTPTAQTPAATTAQPTTAAPSTTTVATGPTTTDATSGIIHNVFCMNADAISCDASGVNVICATDGKLYANQCEFSKAQCKNLSLAHATDPATCVI